MFSLFKKKTEPQEVSLSDRLAQKKSWLTRLRSGLSKSASKLSEGLTSLFTGTRKLDDELLEELEELLIASDIGATTAAELTAHLSKERYNKDITADDIRSIMAQEITTILEPVAIPVDIDEAHKPFIVVVVGVNGNGKTTTIGKMAKLLHESGWSVMLAAADTFRAAAVEQLKVWGERAKCPVITGEEGVDPASVAYQAIEEARRQKAEVLIIDTAGRLQNKADLMAQLQKLTRVIAKQDENAPHSIIQILDATTGQNAHSQVEAFKEMVGVSGLVVTKLDGTAKGGVVIALARKFGLPIHAIGVGESAEDLRPFEAQDFAKSLMNIEI